MKRRKKKAKRIKLELTAKIRRRLRKLWKEKVGVLNQHRCAVCGCMNEGKSYVNAHHIIGYVQSRRLRYDPLNGVLLCPSHHKFGRLSAHKNGIWFAEWLRTNRVLQYQYVLKHQEKDLDLNDRETLYTVEKRINEQQEVAWS